MLTFLKRLFSVISSFDRFMREPLIVGFNGFTVIFGTLILVGGVFIGLDDRAGTTLFSKVFTFITGSFVYCAIPYMFYKSGNVRRYIIFGSKESIEIVTKRFDLKGYIIFVFFFSYFLLFPVAGIPLLLELFDINFLSELLRQNLNVLIYFFITSSSVLWFSYHIIELTVTIPKIKIKVALYLAVGTTLTLINLEGFEDFSIVLSCLLASYLWIQYLIELKSDE